LLRVSSIDAELLPPSAIQEAAAAARKAPVRLQGIQVQEGDYDDDQKHPLKILKAFVKNGLGSCIALAGNDCADTIAQHISDLNDYPFFRALPVHHDASGFAQTMVASATAMSKLLSGPLLSEFRATLRASANDSSLAVNRIYEV
jgi:hypothetical protein